MARLAALVLFSALFAGAGTTAKGSSRHDQTWLAITDVHLDPFELSTAAGTPRADSDPALLRSALAAMKRAQPDPPVVLITGDFFEHHLAVHARARGETPEQAGLATMRQLAAMFGRTFPKAQFIVTLGNNDAPCGDYWTADRSAYLKSVARVWAPLVNRRGVAPNFVRAFGDTGYYAARSPLDDVRFVVLNSVLFSQQYRGNCGADRNDAYDELQWLKEVLRDSPPGVRNVIVMHVPPGFDPFSTQYARGLLAWPFWKEPFAATLRETFAANAGRIAYAIAGHAHRFDFRLIGNVPIVVLGSLSPVFDNDPAFYGLHVAPNGSLRDLDIHVFDTPSQKWLRTRSFDAAWGVSSIDAASLARIHAKLATDAAARRAWGAQSNGRPTNDAAGAGAWATRWWRLQWCAQTELGERYSRCAKIYGRPELALLLATAVVALAVLTFLVLASRPGPARRKCGD